MADFFRFSPFGAALLIQISVLLGLALFAAWLPQWIAPPYPDWAWVMAQSGLALLLSILWRLPWWWWPLQCLLPVFLYWALWFEVEPLLGLVLFILLWLLFGNVFKERVPLYLTNGLTRQALAQLASEHGYRRFIDLGCGTGENVHFMAQQPSIELAMGVETAWLPFWLARWRNRTGRGQIMHQDLWQSDLRQFDLVYAFLSPQPMPRLWHKLQQELAANACFVSNSFAVPEQTPSEIWVLDDRRQTHLYLYRMADFKIASQPGQKEKQNEV
ncbi:MAG: hypothetical protein JXR44_06610 [Thiotrichales bacterium]|nr:hypothetical protein [Thiotrichales bacterium]